MEARSWLAGLQICGFAVSVSRIWGWNWDGRRWKGVDLRFPLVIHCTGLH
jgi:hypothetical protein